MRSPQNNIHSYMHDYNNKNNALLMNIYNDKSKYKMD